MAEIKFHLDGQEVTAQEGETILDVARREGKKIPTLCHDPRLEPFSSCFVCLVEMEGKPGFVPSCATKVAPGMNIRTDSEEIRAARKMALELIMSAHDADCVAPCRMTCPDNIDIQTYIAQIAAEDFAGALETIKRTNPFPSVCGRVCPHSCEMECRRTKVDGAVAINPLKRFVADLDLKAEHPYRPEVAPETGKKIAVIGGGPAGLTAAYYMRQKGHAVTVFEMNEHGGGMLRYGIPSYRLPDDVLDREIAHIADLGVEIQYGKKMGRDFQLAELKAQGFDAAFIAVGAWASTAMRVEGEDSEGVLSGIGYLFDVAADKAPDLGKQVVVVGGGNTAIDAARTARRFGSDVTILYRRTRKEMPAEEYEVDEADEEGVKMHFLAAPVGLIAEGGRVVRIRAQRMELGEPDASGRRRPVPMEGSEFEIEVDTVIAAIGQKPDPDSWAGEGAPGVTRWNSVEADEKTYQSSVDWIFTGGDCLTGAATAIEAIAAGRKAAISIDRFLKGLKPLPIGKPFTDQIARLEDFEEEFFADVERVDREQASHLSVAERIDNFKEVEFAYDEAQAFTEAGRCLECGCTAVDSCTLRQVATEYEADLDRFELEFRHRPVRDEHPFIIHDPNKCILCGRCVRICSEQQGLGALGFVDRGFDTTIQPSLGLPLLETDCDACGQCIGACPTGALDIKRVLPKSGPYFVDFTPVACGFCSVACRLTVESTRGRYVQVSSEPGRHHNQGNLCVDGTFGHRYLETMQRLQKPLIRKGEKAQLSSWDEALDAAAAGLKAGAQGKGVALVLQGPLTNEVAFTLQQLARGPLADAHLLTLDGPGKAVAFQNALRPEQSEVGLSDIETADRVWVLGSDPFEQAPVAGVVMRNAARAGVPICVIAARAGRLDEVASRVLRVPAIRMAGLFEGLSQAAGGELGDDFAELAMGLGLKPELLVSELVGLRDAKRAVIVCGDDLAQDAASALGVLLEKLGLVKRLLVLRRAGNGLGREMMGLHPALSAGGQLRATAGPESDRVLEGLKKGQYGAVLLVNTDPYGCGLAHDALADGVFLTVMDMQMTALADRAQVVLPVAGLAEESGTLFNLDRMVLPTTAVRASAGGLSNLAILGGLGEKLGMAVAKDAKQAWRSLAESIPAASRIQADELDLDGQLWSD